MQSDMLGTFTGTSTRGKTTTPATIDQVFHYTEPEERIPAKLKTIESLSSPASSFVLIQKPQKWLPLVPLSRTQKTNWWCRQQTSPASSPFTFFYFMFFPCIVASYFPLNVGSWDYWRQIQTLNVRPMFCQHFGFGIIQSVNNWFNHRLQTLFIQCML